MKRMILLMGLAFFCLLPNRQSFAAISNAPVPSFSGENLSPQISQKKTKRMNKRLSKIKKRWDKKRRFGGRIGLDFIGLTVIGVGGLFIWGGLAIPFVGWLFVGIGAIVALVGLLLLTLLGGISVDVN